MGKIVGRFGEFYRQLDFVYRGPGMSQLTGHFPPKEKEKNSSQISYRYKALLSFP
jgi:hypothetical protein